MILARSLSKAFGKHPVLADIDLTVQAGERLAILGLNGAGKTTLIRCFLGLIPFEGELEVAGVDVRSAGREARARLGYVPQRAPQFEGSLADVVAFFTTLRGASRDVAAARLEQFGLPLDEHGAKPLQALSGGMLQKVLLALALGDDVPLLLLDEPTANLDPRARREFLRVLSEVDRTTTVLLASHRLMDVEAVADRLVVLHDGHVMFDGSLPTLKRRIGAEATLWVRVTPAQRASADERLRSQFGADAVRANGTAVGIRGDAAVLGEVLHELRRAGISIEEFWTEAPSLHELLEGALGARSEAEA
jgi:ABC-type multidrug transport system ATPase subunit